MPRPLTPAERVTLETQAESLRNRLNNHTNAAGEPSPDQAQDSARLTALIWPDGVPR